MDNDESKPRRRWPTYVVVMPVLLFVVYPLSVGPAAILAYQYGWLNGELVELFYSPLFNVAIAVGGDDALIAYLDWCYARTD